MRALEDAAVFINEAVRWARIKTGWNSEILPEKQNHIENVWVLKFPNGLHFLLWLYSQVCFLKVVDGSIRLVSYLLSNVKAPAIKCQSEHRPGPTTPKLIYSQRCFFFFFNIYLFGCVGSQLWLVGFSLCQAWSFIVANRLSSCSAACGILLPRPGIKPVSPVSQGRFLTTGPPGKSHLKGLLTDTLLFFSH